MTHIMGTRGSKGALTIRRGADWGLAPAAVRGMSLSIRASAADAATGTFEGWGCVYGVRDSYGTTFQAGCFAEGGLEDTDYPLLWMHQGSEPVGIFTAEERDQGLWIAGEYDPTVQGQTARSRALSGSAPELSVGFVWLDDGGEDDPDLITSARLVETSQITLRMAAVPGAALQGVRVDDTPDEEFQAAQARAAAMLDLRLADAYTIGE